MGDLSRTVAYERNTGLELLLGKLNARLKSPVQTNISGKNSPMLFIVGVPRSGTTLILQWLAGTGQFAYPSNFISRFYQAPDVGAMIQEMMINPQYAYRDEMTGFPESLPDDPYSSVAGKTVGWLAPNEFYYFWRRFYPVADSYQPILNPEEFAFEPFRRELTAVAGVLNKPFVLKAIIANWIIHDLAEIIENSVFLYIHRDHASTVRSILDIRKQMHGSTEFWYSFRPPEYEAISQLSPEKQVVAQVEYTQKAIEAGLFQIDSQRVIRTEYEHFCYDPAMVWQTIADRFKELGCPLNPNYRGPEKFTISRSTRSGVDSVLNPTLENR